MRIIYLDIRNFRGVKSLKASLSGNFNCLIGSGDSCKSSILNAIDYALSSRWQLSFDDTDFFKQDTANPISISVTLCITDDDLKNEPTKHLFTESKFGQLLGGFNETGPTLEPKSQELSLTVNLTVNESLEPEWTVIKGEETKKISATDRGLFGVGRIDIFLDNNFTWGRNSLLTRLSLDQGKKNLNSILTEIARSAKRYKLGELENFNKTAESIKKKAKQFGVNLNNLLPKLDIQKLSLSSGALSLHNQDIPIRNLGSGSKKLISCAIQMEFHHGKNITLIDEIELGLEPHRIRGLIKNLKDSGQQVITTTHSPVVLRELNVNQHELYVCRSDENGNISIKPMAEVPGCQGPVRSNAEAFLGKKIIVCEGATEVGCLRALDEYKLTTPDYDHIPVWTLSTAYYDAGGISKVKTSAIALYELGYQVAILCDNDQPDTFGIQDINELKKKGIQVFHWDDGNSIEQQLINDLAWQDFNELLNVIDLVHDDKNKEGLIQSIRSRYPQISLSAEVEHWVDTIELRRQIGYAAAGKDKDGKPLKNNKGSPWFKRMNYAVAVFRYALPKLNDKTNVKNQLNSLWQWVQSE